MGLSLGSIYICVLLVMVDSFILYRFIWGSHWGQQITWRYDHCWYGTPLRLRWCERERCLSWHPHIVSFSKSLSFFMFFSFLPRSPLPGGGNVCAGEGYVRNWTGFVFVLELIMRKGLLKGLNKEEAMLSQVPWGVGPVWVQSPGISYKVFKVFLRQPVWAECQSKGDWPGVSFALDGISDFFAVLAHFKSACGMYREPNNGSVNLDAMCHFREACLGWADPFHALFARCIGCATFVGGRIVGAAKCNEVEVSCGSFV